MEVFYLPLASDDSNQRPLDSFLTEEFYAVIETCHSDENDDVHRTMQKADARMYEVKEEYYSRHPEYEWHSKPV